jgi:hypothetical protein
MLRGSERSGGNQLHRLLCKVIDKVEMETKGKVLEANDKRHSRKFDFLI